MIRHIWRNYFTWPLLSIMLFGFSSGLPLVLVGQTLSARFYEAKLDLVTIGLLGAVGIPYTLKFFWAPIMDSLGAPVFSKLFGRRRGWILLTQILLMGALVMLACAEPLTAPVAAGLSALLVAFFSASQDIVIDAYRVEILTPEEQGEGAAMIQLGYRLGMLVAGAGALYLASFTSWQNTYLIMAGLIGIGLVTTLCVQEPASSKIIEAEEHPHSFKEWVRASVIAPFADMARHHSWALVLVFIVLYKLADAFIGFMSTPFLLSIGFTKINIANTVKIYGTIATLAGIFIGGGLTARYGSIRVLFGAGMLHAITNLLYALQAHVGLGSTLLAVSVSVENLTGGIGTAAFVAYLSGLCNVHYTATQYALLSSLAGLGRSLLSTPAGYVAKALGWGWFFTFSAMLAIPGLLLLWVLNKRLTTSPRAGAT